MEKLMVMETIKPMTDHIERNALKRDPLDLSGDSISSAATAPPLTCDAYANRLKNDARSDRSVSRVLLRYENIRRILLAFFPDQKPFSDVDDEAIRIAALEDPRKIIQAVKDLIPEVFLSPNAKKLHILLSEYYPDLLPHLEGTAGERTAFPASGIPAQAQAIKKAGIPAEFDVSLGVAVDDQGNILSHPFVVKIMDQLKPDDMNPNKWLKVRNAILTYNNGLGSPWYREIAKMRYLNDVPKKYREDFAKSLRIKPIPVAAGTTGLDVAMALTTTNSAPIIIPKTLWRNVNLKAAHYDADPKECNYIDENGDLNPGELQKGLENLKNRGHKKATVYFNFPHNPTAAMPNNKKAEEMRGVIQELADENFAITVICDEPYDPFTRGEDAIDRPFSYYMRPGDNKHILTFVSRNGTKRDGIYGLRHADLMLLTSEKISDDGVIQGLEKGVLAGYIRGFTSFSNALNQYIVARALSGDPSICLKDPNKDGEWNAESVQLGMKRYAEEEEKIVRHIEETVNRTADFFDNIPGLTQVRSKDIDAAGGFFISYRVEITGVSPKAIHEAACSLGRDDGCGVIAAEGYLRINGLVSKKNLEELKRRLLAAIKKAKDDNVKQQF